MSWNQPPNGQAGLMQQPPMPHGPPTTMSMNPPPPGPGGLPPKGYGLPPPAGQFTMPPSGVAGPPPSVRPLSTNNGPPPSIQPSNSPLPPRPGNPDSPQINRPPPSNFVNTSAPAASGSELLPAPYHGKGIYSHNTHVGPPPPNLTPTNSEPSSLNTSRVPSPIPTQQFDALEGQFRIGTPNSNKGTPPSGSPIPQATPSPRATSNRPYFPQPSNSLNGGVYNTPISSVQTSTANRPSTQPPPTGLPPGAPTFQQHPPPLPTTGGVTAPQVNIPPFNYLPAQQPPRPFAPNQPSGPPGSFQMPGAPPGAFPQPLLPGSQPPRPMGSFPPSGPPGSYQQPGPPGSFPPSGTPGSFPLSGTPGSFLPSGTPGSFPPSGPPGSFRPPGPPTSYQQPGLSSTPQPPGPPSSFQHPVPSGPQPPLSTPAPTYPYGGPGSAPAQPNTYGLDSKFGNMGIQQPHQVPPEMRTFNLLQERNILPAEAVTPPMPNLPEHLKRNNCSPDIFRCTVSCMPQSNSLLQKSRLPLGILIHPFKDLSTETEDCTSVVHLASESGSDDFTDDEVMLSSSSCASVPQSFIFLTYEDNNHLPVIQSSVIVRCRSCRTYINPFVSFIDQRRWRCNLCYRANELPEEFNFDPVSKSYGSPERRPEIKSATIEFAAPSEYMLRPPQPSVYLFLLDVSYHALQSGGLQAFCEVLLEELDKLPGDSRTMIGFITYNSSIHFYNLSEDLSTPQIHIVSDIDDIFLPLPDGLLANLQASRPLVEQLLQQLPTYHQDEFMRDDNSAMGAALQAALKMTTATGGRVTVVQTSLPNIGPGKLTNREDPNQRASTKPANLQPATDFYKLLSLEAAGQQIAIDMFLLNNQYIDYATIGGAARHSGGCIHAYPGLHSIHNPAEVERFEQDFRRYITRKIGLEAVMRVRCTKGLSIHTFHGNFFVRSTDLLSLPNINPDAGFGMQVSIEENLTESPYACMQAALLYTSSKGERRIRVHTICLPVSTSLSDVINGADQQAIVSMLSKMAVDRSKNSAVNDAREALVNACVDALGAYGNTLSNQQRMGALPSPYSLRLLPMYVCALLKHPSIRTGVSTKTDDRIYAMDQCKSLPLSRLMQELVPDLYPVHALNDDGGIDQEETIIPQPPRLALNSASIDRHGAFLLDNGNYLYLWIGSAISSTFCADVFDKPDFTSIPDGLCDLRELENETSERLRTFVGYLQDSWPSAPPLIVIREDSRSRHLFTQHMVEDKSESSMSYYEFLQHIQKLLKAS